MRKSRYKWIALSNTSLGVFMASLNANIVLISLPAVFRGIHINPMAPGNSAYLLWLLMGYTVSYCNSAGFFRPHFGYVRASPVI